MLERPVNKEGDTLFPVLDRFTKVSEEGLDNKKRNIYILYKYILCIYIKYIT